MGMNLRFEDVSIGYGERVVLRDVSLDVPAGEMVAVVGPNAVGKSTLVRAASGILPPMTGMVRIGEKSLASMSPEERARHVAVVPQAVRLPPAFTTFSMVLMGRTPYLGWFERENESDKHIAMQALQRVGLTTDAHRKVGELSGGEQQLALIARALAQEASVIILDEPTAHLDLRHQDVVLKLVRKLAEKDGLTVMITLHDLNLVSRFCDRVALLSDGGIRKQGVPAEVLTPEELAAVYGIAIHVMPHPIHGTPLVLSG
jgi:iron complex transport system ATP-binding protein